jgi:hypothetical protein
MYTYKMKKVTYDSNGLKIHGTLCIPETKDKPFPAVIIFHGMTSSEASYIALTEKLEKLGIAGLAVSMRGHGESEGDFQRSTVKESISDGTASYDYLCSIEGVDNSRIGLVGSSVGTILAAMTSAQRNVKSIVLRAPAAYTSEMMELSMAGTMVNEGRQFHEIKELASTPAGTAIASFTGDLLVVASEKDMIIPHFITDGYVDLAEHAKSKGLFTIKGAPHNLTGEYKDTFNQLAANWFKDTLSI